MTKIFERGITDNTCDVPVLVAIMISEVRKARDEIGRAHV